MENFLAVEEVQALQPGDWIWLVDLHDGTRSAGTYREIDKQGPQTVFLDGRCSGFRHYFEYGSKWVAYKNKEADLKANSPEKTSAEIEEEGMSILLAYDILLNHTAQETAQHLIKAGYGDKQQAVKDFIDTIDTELTLMLFQYRTIQDMSQSGVPYANGIADCLNKFRELAKELSLIKRPNIEET